MTHPLFRLFALLSLPFAALLVLGGEASAQSGASLVIQNNSTLALNCKLVRGAAKLPLNQVQPGQSGQRTIAVSKAGFNLACALTDDSANTSVPFTPNQNGTYSFTCHHTDTTANTGLACDFSPPAPPSPPSP